MFWTQGRKAFSSFRMMGKTSKRGDSRLAVLQTYGSMGEDLTGIKGSI